MVNYVVILLDPIFAISKQVLKREKGKKTKQNRMSLAASFRKNKTKQKKPSLAWVLKHLLARGAIQSKGKLIMLHQSIKLRF